jgi:hypothetical protein
MKYVCDAPGDKTWFRIETLAEAAVETDVMRHAVEKFFRQEHDKATQSYQPPSGAFIERDIGLNAHVQRSMPLFLTLRDAEGNALATAMLPPEGRDERNFRMIVVGAGNNDPYTEQGEAIRALARHLGIALDRERCYPYHRA